MIELKDYTLKYLNSNLNIPQELIDDFYDRI